MAGPVVLPPTRYPDNSGDDRERSENTGWDRLHGLRRTTHPTRSGVVPARQANCFSASSGLLPPQEPLTEYQSARGVESGLSDPGPPLHGPTPR